MRPAFGLAENPIVNVLENFRSEKWV